MSTANGQIRNFQQSVQYRDVTKQASDVLVYIDGADYLVNPYLGETGVPVPFNDYVNSWTSTYDIDSMVPSGSLTLTVPMQNEYLFRYPGGNNLLNTMAEIRVFAKGYYLSAEGNTVYRQIFKGFISSISYAKDGTMVNISMSCSGALAMLERMQIDQNPALMSSTTQASTPYSSTSWNLDPYQSIAWVFLYRSMIDGFEIYSVQQMALEQQSSTGGGNPYYEAVQEGFIAKWQALLFDLARDVHIFGAPNVSDVIASIQDNTRKTDAANTPFDKKSMGIAHDIVGKTGEVAQVTAQSDFYDQLRGYMPDMGFSSIQLLNGRVTSRLERLRFMTSHVGFEAFQDIDGGIVIKPPLYNLDVVNLVNDGSVANVPADTGIDPSLAYITPSSNPFVVQQSEILNEQENEDEAGVRLTRITARGSYNPGFQIQASKEMLAVAEDIDIPKLTQFGLRTEPPREANWFRSSDEKAIYAYAASEMARANRGFRTYSITIPMRPELKLGFPMYLPHKDIYGYIKSVTMSWTRGSNASTSVVLDSLRRRPLFAETQTIPATDGGQPTQIRLMTQSPNLVTQWTKANQNAVAQKQAASAQLAGKLASLPIPQQLVVKQQLQMTESRNATGLEYTMNSDSVTHNWRIQPDTAGVFSQPRKLNADYFSNLRKVRPYTDDKGYELVGPFPWGRWKSLKDSLTTFTIANSLYAKSTETNPALQPVSAATGTLSNVDAFLFTGDSVAASTDTATNLIGTLTTQRSTINKHKVFELSYSNDPTLSSGPTSTLGASAEPQPGVNTSSTDAAALSSAMLFGEATSATMFESILDSVPLVTPDE